ncbi:MAG: DUF2330 domain-containing protein [Sandaracinaceae bacterium]
MNRLTTAALGAAALGAAALTLPAPAAACGGFFCNNQAIDQSGENILFSYNADGTITTVVQILYTGPSEEFAWILPVPAEPTVDVGTDTLFQQLGQSTVPRFTTDRETTGTCRSQPSCRGYWDDRGWGPESEDSFGAAADAGVAPPSDPDVDVRLRANVGPYDVAVLAAGSADALREWLDDNGYLIPESAAGELDHYVELDHFFVALRLQKNRDAGEIQPIVLTSASDEPCIPIRLTRIATVPNMPITAYFLAERRARPMNFMLVDADLDDFGLYTGLSRYNDAVTTAVDDAGGRAFVTDYAGDVPTLSLRLMAIEDLREETDPAAFLRGLQDRGFTGDSQLLNLLQTFLPPPEEYEAQTFYNCLIQGWCIDEPGVVSHLESLGFSPNSLVDAINQAIVDPRNAAQDMLDAHSTITRLFTTMSADEMTEDPMFMLSDELEREVSNVHTATRTTECGPEYFSWTAPQTLTLPSGLSRVERVGVPYYGSDDAYCEDRYEGDFRPGMPTERLREVSDERGTTPGGGGICSVSPARDASMLGSVGVVGFAMMAFVWRRRRS